MPFSRFHHSALYHDYYRRVGIDHAMTLPVYVDGRWLVSFVLNRAGRDFSDSDCARLDLLRDTIGTLYRKSRLIAELRAALRAAINGTEPTLPTASAAALLTVGALARLALTARECEVLRWLAAGKTDRAIGQILAISVRTVH